MRIPHKTGLAMVAGFTVMAVGAGRIPAADITIPSTDVPQTILDLQRVSSTLNWTVSGMVIDVDVSNLNIAHPWDGDVRISLSRPGGALVQIFADCGGSDDNFTNVTISDEGVPPVCTANGLPHTGPLRGAPNGVPSATVMTAFDGVSPVGIWTLVISDDSAGDESPGRLTSWSLTLGFPIFPLPVELMKPEVG